MTPLNIEEILIDHQMPERPKKGVKSIDSGIRSDENMIETIGGAYVLPKPLNAPTLNISKHMKTWENAIATMYPTPISITSGSDMKIEKIGLGKIKNMAVTTKPNTVTSFKDKL